MCRACTCVIRSHIRFQVGIMGALVRTVTLTQYTLCEICKQSFGTYAQRHHQCRHYYALVCAGLQSPKTQKQGRQRGVDVQVRAAVAQSYNTRKISHIMARFYVSLNGATFTQTVRHRRKSTIIQENRVIIANYNAIQSYSFNITLQNSTLNYKNSLNSYPLIGLILTEFRYKLGIVRTVISCYALRT